MTNNVSDNIFNQTLSCDREPCIALGCDGSQICTIPVTDIAFIITFVLRHLEVIISFLGNGLVLVSFSRCNYLRIPTCYLICCLSVSDLIGATLSPVIHMMAYVRGTEHWINLCHYKLVLMMMFALGNVLFSFLIALERLITLSFPLSYMTILTSQRSSMCIVIAWLYLVIYTVSLPITNHHHIITMRNTECLAATALTEQSHNIGTIQLYIFSFGIIIVYALIGRIAWQKSGSPNKYLNETQKAQWKITKMMGSIVLLYGICYLPLFLTDRMMKSDLTNINYARYYYMSTVVYFISTWINPFLYGSKSVYFRRAFCKILPKGIFRCLFSTRVEDQSSPVYVVTFSK